jgi:hypothetical protein
MLGVNCNNACKPESISFDAGAVEFLIFRESSANSH